MTAAHGWQGSCRPERISRRQSSKAQEGNLPSCWDATHQRTTHLHWQAGISTSGCPCTAGHYMPREQAESRTSEPGRRSPRVPPMLCQLAVEKCSNMTSKATSSEWIWSWAVNKLVTGKEASLSYISYRVILPEDVGSRDAAWVQLLST